MAGEVALSLEHWLLAGDPRSALRLLAARHGPLHDAGGEAIIRHTINAIPDEAATANLWSTHWDTMVTQGSKEVAAAANRNPAATSESGLP